MKLSLIMQYITHLSKSSYHYKLDISSVGSNLTYTTSQ